MPQLPIKITQLSKDFNIKAKDIIDLFHELGIEKKSGGSVELDEFEIFVQKITVAHQIKDADAYRDGKIKITSRAAKEKVAAERAEAERVAKEKAARELEEKRRREAEEKKAAEAKAAKERAEQKPQVKPQARPEQPMQRVDRPRVQENRPDMRQDRRDRQQSAPSYQKYNAAPQANPFAKKLDNMTRAAQGLRSQGSQWQKPAEAQKPREEIKRPAPAPSTVAAPAAQVSEKNAFRPAQAAQLEKQQKQVAKPAPLAEQKPKKEEKKAQKQQFKTITREIDKSSVQGGVNIGADYSSTTGPKTRVVDMRTSDVNLSKYDDRYNEQYYAILNGTDNKSSKQKLKKQDNKGQNQKSAKDKERAAQERIKKLEAERARNKQLEFTVPDEITVTEFSSRLKKSAAEVIKKLMFMGEMKGLNDTIDYATAELIADEFGAKVTREVVVTI